MPKNKKEDLRRTVFGGGSFFYSARAIPGLEKDKLPVVLVDGSETEGDTMRCVGVSCFGAPELLLPKTNVSGVTQSLSDISFYRFEYYPSTAPS